MMKKVKQEHKKKNEKVVRSKSLIQTYKNPKKNFSRFLDSTSKKDLIASKSVKIRNSWHQRFGGAQDLEDSKFEKSNKKKNEKLESKNLLTKNEIIKNEFKEEREDDIRLNENKMDTKELNVNFNKTDLVRNVSQRGDIKNCQNEPEIDSKWVPKNESSFSGNNNRISVLFDNLKPKQTKFAVINLDQENHLKTSKFDKIEIELNHAGPFIKNKSTLNQSKLNVFDVALRVLGNEKLAEIVYLESIFEQKTLLRFQKIREKKTRQKFETNPSEIKKQDEQSCVFPNAKTEGASCIFNEEIKHESNLEKMQDYNFENLKWFIKDRQNMLDFGFGEENGGRDFQKPYNNDESCKKSTQFDTQYWISNNQKKNTLNHQKSQFEDQYLIYNVPNKTLFQKDLINETSQAHNVSYIETQKQGSTSNSQLNPLSESNYNVPPESNKMEFKISQLNYQNQNKCDVKSFNHSINQN